MNIRLLHLLSGAGQATGLAIVIDVFRAFTTACYLVNNGVKAIHPVTHREDAYHLQTRHPDWLLVGERGGKMIPGFDHGNSPAEIQHLDLTGKTVVLTTSSGTRGLLAASHADAVITGSFVNAAAVVDHVRKADPDTVSIISMGSHGRERTLEDDLCGAYLRDCLLGKETDFTALADRIRATPGSRKFLDPEQPWFPTADLDLCLNLDRFAFVLELNRSGALLPHRSP